jgi:hypothetical protein
MKRWCSLLVFTSLALTACMTPATDDEELAADEQALTSPTTLAGSCGTWSSWSWDGQSATCGVRLSCGTYCDQNGVCEVNPASNKLESSYRVCFDQYGNYTHTEYQYRSGGFIACGC